jgi:uncharacterized protein (TIGR02391 family)
VHVETGFGFSIEFVERWQDEYGASGGGFFRYYRAPGVQTRSELLEAPSWNDVVGDFRLWVRLVARELGRGDAVVPTSAPQRAISHHDAVWALVHPDIRAIAYDRFQSRHYADAVEASLKHINALVQARCKEISGKELDGSKLMKHVFSVEKPMLLFGDPTTESGKSMQVGYMELFSGTMMGVRNPKAHANIEITEERGLHFIILASLLRYKLDEAREA